jgi:[ribosomal protein S18]-alanine N-acetyltransferase
VPEILRLKEIILGDLPQIEAIDRDCLGGFWGLGGYIQEIERPDSCLLAVVNSENLILGFGCLWAVLEEAHITTLAVRPEYQCQGLGKYLVWGLLDTAYRRGLEWAALEVRISNRVAIALYEKFDFKIIGNRPKYYELPSEDGLVMWRKGLNAPDFPETLAKWHSEIKLESDRHGWKIS